MFKIRFELLYNLPPQGSIIFGWLIIDGCKTGLTFEEIFKNRMPVKVPFLIT